MLKFALNMVVFFIVIYSLIVKICKKTTPFQNLEKEYLCTITPNGHLRKLLIADAVRTRLFVVQSRGHCLGIAGVPARR